MDNRPKQGAKRRPVVESLVLRAGKQVTVPFWSLFGYHRSRAWELSGECRLKVEVKSEMYPTHWHRKNGHNNSAVLVV